MLGASLDLSQVVEALHSSFYGVVHGDQWLVAQDLFGFLTAVVVECASQCDPHWCESGLKLDDRTDHHHQEGQQDSQTVGYPVRNVVLGGLIIEACQDAGQECPERDGFIIGDVECLKREQEVRDCFPAGGMSRPHSELGAQAQLLARPRINVFGKPVATPCPPLCPSSFAGHLQSEANIKPIQIAAYLWFSNPQLSAAGGDNILTCS